MIVFALVACKGDEAPPGSHLASSYALPAGVRLVFAPLDTPEGATETLGRSGPRWELRDGDDWDDGAVLDSFAVDDADGIVVDGVLLLPAVFQKGTTEGGAKITGIGPHETWYGTFDDTVEVEVSSGRWEGTQRFAATLGPVTVTLDGLAWDLVSYDR